MVFREIHKKTRDSVKNKSFTARILPNEPVITTSIASVIFIVD